MSRTTASPNLTTQLNREPSREELEIARHLNDLSQGTTSAQRAAESYRGSEYQREAHEREDEAGGNPANHEHHDLSDTLQGFQAQQQTPQHVATAQQRASSTNSPSLSGQMCRYAGMNICEQTGRS